MAESSEAHPSGPAGNVKLVGISGLVKGEQFSVEVGQSVVVGRSRGCDFCMRDVPAAQEILNGGGDLEEHFRTVSRQHVQITYHAPDKVELKDLSSNGSFLDGERIDGSVTISDLVSTPHELKLGTSETFCLDWWKLVHRSEVPMVKVKVKRKPEEEPEATEEAEGEQADADAS